MSRPAYWIPPAPGFAAAVTAVVTSTVAAAVTAVIMSTVDAAVTTVATDMFTLPLLRWFFYSYIFLSLQYC